MKQTGKIVVKSKTRKAHRFSILGKALSIRTIAGHRYAPPDFSDRSILWNSVEKIEKAKNSQLAREIEIALPVELDREQQIQLVREYVKQKLIAALFKFHFVR